MAQLMPDATVCRTLLYAGPYYMPDPTLCRTLLQLERYCLPDTTVCPTCSTNLIPLINSDQLDRLYSSTHLVHADKLQCVLVTLTFLTLTMALCAGRTFKCFIKHRPRSVLKT